MEVWWGGVCARASASDRSMGRNNNKNKYKDWGGGRKYGESKLQPAMRGYLATSSEGQGRGKQVAQNDLVHLLTEYAPPPPPTITKAEEEAQQAAAAEVTVEDEIAQELAALKEQKGKRGQLKKRFAAIETGCRVSASNRDCIGARPPASVV